MNLGNTILILLFMNSCTLAMHLNQNMHPGILARNILPNKPDLLTLAREACCQLFLERCNRTPQKPSNIHNYKAASIPPRDKNDEGADYDKKPDWIIQKNEQKKELGKKPSP